MAALSPAAQFLIFEAAGLGAITVAPCCTPTPLMGGKGMLVHPRTDAQRAGCASHAQSLQAACALPAPAATRSGTASCGGCGRPGGSLRAQPRGRAVGDTTHHLYFPIGASFRGCAARADVYFDFERRLARRALRGRERARTSLDLAGWSGKCCLEALWSDRMQFNIICTG